MKINEKLECVNKKEMIKIMSKIWDRFETNKESVIRFSYDANDKVLHIEIIEALELL